MEIRELLTKLKKEPMRRTFSLDRAAVKATERTVDLAFSSELPYARWWGIEVLDHSKGAMRMDRAKDGIAVLFNHGRSEHLGIMSDCRCDDDRVGRGTARFGKGPLASEKWQDVADEILKDVSVGYEIHFMQEVDPKDLSPDLMEMAAREKLPVYRITDWEPYECSFVTVPADPTVGVGRSAEAGATAPEGAEVPKAVITVLTQKKKGDGEMDKTLEEMERDTEEQRKKASKDATERERARVQGITDIYDKFKQFIPEFVRRKAVDEGMPLTDFQALALKRMEDPKPVDSPITELGLSSRELRRYSITKAMLGQWKESGVDAGFERSCHDELVKRGVEAKKGGVLIPYDIMSQRTDPFGTRGQRDLSLASDAAGGYLKGTDHLGSEFIDILRNAMLLRRLGARVLTGLRGNVAIPKRTAGAVSYWVTDGSAPTEGTSTFAQVSLTPRNLASNIDFTRGLLLQSNPSIDALVNGDLALSLALGIDLAGFHGTGTEQPQGIVGTSGVGAVTATAVNLTKMFEFQTDVAAANALAAMCAYVTTPAVAGILASQPRFTYGQKPLWDGNLLESTDVCGFRGFATNQITAGYMIFGDFSQLLIGEWGVLELVVDPYTQSKNGIIQVTAFQSVDVALRYPGAFTVSTSVTAP